ncbi:MAG TPA: hypothetical protein VFK23_10760 [Nitrospirota bacterium]|jgi:hypothetical protein|nr:hypothetical protein [Nitrospirota bacterium]
MIEALREEEKKLRLVRFIVDLNQAILMQQADLTLREAFDILSNTRKAVLNLFPDKESVFDLVYSPRFRRIIRERFVIPGGLAGPR